MSRHRRPWFDRWHRKGDHRGIYEPRAHWSHGPDCDCGKPIYLSDCIWRAKVYGIYSDRLDSPAMTATLEIVPTEGVLAVPLTDLVGAQP